MSQRLTLDESDFKKLCRGEVVTQGALQCALQGTGPAQMFNALVDALHDTASSLVCDGQGPIAAFILEEDEEEIRRWIHGINQDVHEGFLHAFARAVCRAGETDYPLLRRFSR